MALAVRAGGTVNQPPNAAAQAGIRTANLALSFLLELAALSAIAFWGFHSGQSYLLKLLFGLGVPLLVAILWGTFAAPKASMRLKGVSLWIFELGVFGLAIAALALAGQPFLAGIFAVVLVINRILMYIWKQ
jgi:hypothetical protein